MFNKHLLKDLNENQQKLVKWLEQNKEIVKKGSITQVAKLNHVSPSFLTKTLNKLGYVGYKDYKSLIIHSQIPTFNTGKDYYLEKTEKRLFSSITRTLKTIDEIKIQDVAAKIINPNKKTYFVGEGFSFFISLDQVRRYTKSGIPVFSLQAEDCDGYPFQTNDFVVLISASGLTASIHRSFKYLKAQKVDNVVISANPYARHFFHDIICGVVNYSTVRNERELPLNSRIIILVILDWIYNNAMKKHQYQSLA